MDQRNDHQYYVNRAAAAAALAQRAVDPAIAAIHREMANRYETTAAGIAQVTRTPNDLQVA